MITQPREVDQHNVATKTPEQQQHRLDVHGLTEVDVLASLGLALAASHDRDCQRNREHDQQASDEHRNGFRTQWVHTGAVVAELEGVDQDHDAGQGQEHADPVLSAVARTGRRGIPCGRGCFAHARPSLVRTSSTAAVCSVM